jgi:hypothetical protein
LEPVIFANCCDLCLSEDFSVVSSSSFDVHVPHVVGLGAEEQVTGSDTGWVVADVADAHPCWDGAVSEFPREAVSVHLAASDLQESVTPLRGRGPHPTVASLVDFRPEALLNDRVYHSRCLPSQGHGQAGADGETSASVVILLDKAAT